MRTPLPLARCCTRIVPRGADVRVALVAEVPVATTSYLLIALANLGGKMFNVSAVDCRLDTADGALAQKLKRQQYGEPLGPREQRSFRFGFAPDAETALGEHKLVCHVYYNNREKDQFLSEVFNDTVTLVPAPPDLEARIKLAQTVVGVVAGLLLVVAIVSRIGGAMSSGTSSKPKQAKASAGGETDEWLAATLAGSENRSPKKKKDKRA